MAEIKNSFLRSKMNKDLDDRLVPNGEYRDAQNISVGQSEADDIGALETILGTTVVSNFGLSTTSNTNTAVTASINMTLVTANTGIQVGMIVTGTGIVGTVTIATVNVAGTIFTLSSVQTIALNTTLTYTFADVEVIGCHSDKNKNRMFIFLTDYTDAFPTTAINPTLAPSTAKCYIYEFIPDNTPEYTLLVSGAFLNFNKGSLITGNLNIN